MKLIQHIERLEKIEKLIQHSQTGTPDECAGKIGISRRQLYNYLEEMRSYGVEIRYSRKHQSFRFKNNKRLKIHFACELIDPFTKQQTYGGVQLFSNATALTQETLRRVLFSSKVE